MNAKKFFVSQAIISVAVNMANVLNIVFMLIALRLPIEAFGEISSILAITFLFSLSQSSARNQLLLIHKETGNLAESLGRTIQTVLPMAIVTCVGLACFSGLVAKFLHFQSPLPFIIVSVCALTYASNGIMQGVFATEKNSIHHAASLTIESMCRIPLLFAFLSNGYQAEDVAWILLISGTTALAANICILPPSVRKKLRSAHIRLRVTEDTWTALSILASTILVGVALKIDILWSKHILSPEYAGAYGMMNFVASVLFLGSSGIGRASLSFLGKENFRKTVLWSFGIMMALCAVCILGFYVVGLPILHWISSQGDDIDLQIQLILFAAVASYCIINFSFQCLSVLHRSVHLPLALALVVTQFSGLVAYGGSMEKIAMTQALVMLVFAGAFSSMLLHKQKHVKKQVTHHMHHSIV